MRGRRNADSSWGSRLAAFLPLSLLLCGCHSKSPTDLCAGSQCGECTPGFARACYDGPAETLDAGVCHAGIQACDSDSKWGPCVDEVVPQPEICANGVDDDCDGVVDAVPDLDGDGFSRCEGDCCEDVDGGCGRPAEVHPGAFEIADNHIDDDCDGTIDAPPTCDSALTSNSTEASDLARALDICQLGTVEGSTPGLIEARVVNTNGAGAPPAVQHSIRPSFGAIVPKAGGTMLVLSTGAAAAQGQTNPSFAPFSPGTSFQNDSPLPADWLAANGGSVPTPPGCPPPTDSRAHDPVMLGLKLRVPGNAHSFAFDFFYLTADYPEWVCSSFDDMFVALLDSGYAGMPANPLDKNVAIITSMASSQMPVSSNLAWANWGGFFACRNGPVGCAGPMSGTYSGCHETSSLAGTGFDQRDNACSAGDPVGGGTGWMTAHGNVNPNEIITLRFAIWDSSDSTTDSVVLIDNFRWLQSAGAAGVTLGE